MNEQQAYLGDGVYASFDGWQIWLAVNHHENVQLALDQQTLASLLGYAEKVWGKNEANARLIAAEPDLLEALKMAVSALERSDYIQMDGDSFDVVDVSRAAIAKATGGEA